MKNIVLIISLLISLNLIAQDTLRSSMFFNLGQSFPGDNYRAGTITSSSLKIAESAPFAKSFNMGMDMDIKNNWGYTVGASICEFNTDSVSFILFHKNEFSKSESFLRKHKIASMYLGFYKRYSYHGFEIKPGVNIANMLYGFSSADYYLKNDNNQIISTTNYDYQTNPNIAISFRLNTVYNFLDAGFIKMGVQLFGEYFYSNPRITVNETYSNRETGILRHKEYVINQTVSYLYIGVGLSIGLEHTLKNYNDIENEE